MHILVRRFEIIMLFQCEETCSPIKCHFLTLVDKITRTVRENIKAERMHCFGSKFNTKIMTRWEISEMGF
jgi:hypothetical protein